MKQAGQLDTLGRCEREHLLGHDQLILSDCWNCTKTSGYKKNTEQNYTTNIIQHVRHSLPPYHVCEITK